jgi:peptide chain release factor subunit 3
MLAKTAGVRQLVVAVNKMDDPSILNPDGTWNKARYDECCEKLLPFLKQVSFHLFSVRFNNTM